MSLRDKAIFSLGGRTTEGCEVSPRQASKKLYVIIVVSCYHIFVGSVDIESRVPPVSRCRVVTAGRPRNISYGLCRSEPISLRSAEQERIVVAVKGTVFLGVERRTSVDESKRKRISYCYTIVHDT